MTLGAGRSLLVLGRHQQALQVLKSMPDRFGKYRGVALVIEALLKGASADDALRRATGMDVAEFRAQAGERVREIMQSAREPSLILLSHLFTSMQDAASRWWSSTCGRCCRTIYPPWRGAGSRSRSRSYFRSRNDSRRRPPFGVNWKMRGARTGCSSKWHCRAGRGVFFCRDG